MLYESMGFSTAVNSNQQPVTCSQQSAERNSPVSPREHIDNSTKEYLTLMKASTVNLPDNELFQLTASNGGGGRRWSDPRLQRERKLCCALPLPAFIMHMHMFLTRRCLKEGLFVVDVRQRLVWIS